MSRSLSLSLAGSPSMALTRTVPPGPPAWATASLMAAGNPAPPRPARPEASSADDEGLAPSARARGGQRDRAERGDVAGQVGRMAEQPVAARGGEGLARVRHDGLPPCAARRQREVLRRRHRRPRRGPSSPRPAGRPARSRQASAAATAATQATPSTMTQRLAGVGAHAERVGQRDRPAEIGQPVDGAPGARAHPGPQQAGHEDGDHQVERDGAHADPEAARSSR